MPRTQRFAIAFLLAIGLAVYLPSASVARFVGFDDPQLIVDNPIVHELSARSVARAFTSYDPELYVPLTLMLYQIEYAIAGANPAVFHIANVLLHLLAAWAAYVVARTLLASNTAGFTAAFIFLLHPIQTEAVLWAAATKDVLSGALALWSFVAFLRWREEGGRSWKHVSVALFALALLAKVTVALLPLAFLVVDRLDKRNDARALAPYGVLSIVAVSIALFGKAKTLGTLALWQVPLLAVKSVAVTIGHIVWPVQLTVLYPQQTPVGFHGEFLLSFLVVLLVAVVLAFLCRRSKVATVAIALSLTTFLPSFATFAKNGLLYVTSDRYAYLPVFGVGLLVALGVQRFRAMNERAGIVVATVICAAIFVPLTVLQARTWESTQSLFAHAAAVNPGNALAENNWAAGLEEEQDVEGAMVHYRRAIELDPHYAQPHLNIARLLRAQGKPLEALAEEQAAVTAVSEKNELLPDDVNAHAVFAQSLLSLGRTDEGLAVLAAAVRRAPALPQAYYNLGIALYDDRRVADAKPVLMKAVELQPRSVEARYVLAAVLAESGDLSAAEDQLEAVLRLAPGYERAAEHLANIRRQRGA